MNNPRVPLQRRRFIESGSIFALGAVTTAFASRRLFTSLREKSRGQIASQHPAPAPPGPELHVAPAVPPTPDPPPLRPLQDEDAYAEFLASLELRHLSPHEIIDPHRGVVEGVPNALPPKEIWEKLAPTLKVADEIRERLALPLCRITSAYRCPKYNAVIPGAVRRSYHTRNQALDLVYYCSSRKAYQMALKLRNEGFFRGGVGLYSTFIHIDTRGYAATWRWV